MSLELIQVEELNGKTALTQPTKVEDKVTAKNTKACYDDQGREVDCDTKEVLEQDITKGPAKVNKEDKKVEPLKLISLEEVEENNSDKLELIPEPEDEEEDEVIVEEDIGVVQGEGVDPLTARKKQIEELKLKESEKFEGAQGKLTELVERLPKKLKIEDDASLSLGTIPSSHYKDLYSDNPQAGLYIQKRLVDFKEHAKVNNLDLTKKDFLKFIAKDLESDVRTGKFSSGDLSEDMSLQDYRLSARGLFEGYLSVDEVKDHPLVASKFVEGDDGKNSIDIYKEGLAKHYNGDIEKSDEWELIGINPTGKETTVTKETDVNQGVLSALDQEELERSEQVSQTQLEGYELIFRNKVTGMEQVKSVGMEVFTDNSGTQFSQIKNPTARQEDIEHRLGLNRVNTTGILNLTADDFMKPVTDENGEVISERWDWQTGVDKAIDKATFKDIKDKELVTEVAEQGLKKGDKPVTKFDNEFNNSIFPGMGFWVSDGVMYGNVDMQGEMAAAYVPGMGTTREFFQPGYMDEDGEWVTPSAAPKLVLEGKSDAQIRAFMKKHARPLDMNYIIQTGDAPEGIIVDGEVVITNQNIETNAARKYTATVQNLRLLKNEREKLVLEIEEQAQESTYASLEYENILSPINSQFEVIAESQEDLLSDVRNSEANLDLSSKKSVKKHNRLINKYNENVELGKNMASLRNKKYSNAEEFQDEWKIKELGYEAQQYYDPLTGKIDDNKPTPKNWRNSDFNVQNMYKYKVTHKGTGLEIELRYPDLVKLRDGKESLDDILKSQQQEVAKHATTLLNLAEDQDRLDLLSFNEERNISDLYKDAMTLQKARDRIISERELTWGEITEWGWNHTVQNVENVIGTIYSAPLRAYAALPWWSEYDQRIMNSTIVQLQTGIENGFDTIRTGSQDSDWSKAFDQSLGGQIMAGVLDMVFDVATMRVGGIGRIGYLKKLQPALRNPLSRQSMKTIGAAVLDVNPMMFAREWYNNDRMLQSPEFDGMSNSEKFFYTTGQSWIIGKLDKIGIDATMSKVGPKVVDDIMGYIVKNSKGKKNFAEAATNRITQLIEKGVLKPASRAPGEIITENLQYLEEVGLQDMVNFFKGYGEGDLVEAGFHNADWFSEDMWEEMKTTTIVSGTAATVTGTMFSAISNYTNGGDGALADLNPGQVNLVKNAYNEETLKTFATDLETRVNRGEISREKANELLQANKKIAAIFKKVDPRLNPRDQKKSLNLNVQLDDVNSMIEEMGGKDNPATKPYLEQKKAIEEELGDLTSKAIEKSKKTLKEKTEKAQAAIDETAVESDIVSVDQQGFEEAIKETITPKEGQTQEDIDKEAKILASESYGFFVTEADPETGKKKIILNVDEIAKDNKITTVNHEVFHAVLDEVLKWDRGKDRTALANALKEKLMELDPETLGDSEFAQTLLTYKQDPNVDKEELAEETLTLFSEALTTGDIKFEENFFTKIGDVLRRLFQNISPSLAKIKFGSAKDVYNFIKDYNTSMEKGKFTRAQKRAIKKGAEVNIKEGTTDLDVDFKYKDTRKRVKFKKGQSNLQGLTESMDIDMSKPSGRGRFISETLTKTPQGKETFNFTESTLGQEIGPIVEATTKRLYDKVPQDLKRDITRNEFKNDLISLAGTLIQNEYNPSKQKLDAFVSNRLNLRANKLATDTFGQDFTEDVSEAKGIATETTEDVTIKEKTPTKQIKLKERLGDDAVKITEEVKQRGKDLDLETVDFKTLKDLTPEMTQEMFGISPKPGNLTKADVRNAQQFISKNADTLIAMLPEGSTPSGTSTGVQKVLLDAFYTKGDRVAMAKTGSKAGLKEQTKRDNITKEEFNELFGITPAGQPNLSDRNTSSRIKALVTQTGRMLTNQAIREQAETKGKKVPSKVFEGKSKVMWKRKADKVAKRQLEELINNKNVLETTDEVSLGEELIKELGTFRTLVNAYSTKKKPIKALDLRDENDREEYKGWVLNEFAKRLPKEFFKAAFFSGGRRTLESGALAWLDKADFNKSIKTVKEFGKPDQDIVNATVRIRDGKVTIKDSKGESKTVKFGEKEFTEFNDSKLKGLKKVFEVFEKMINDDPQNIKYIAQFLSSTSSNMGQFIRVASPTRFMQQNLEGKKTIEEHTLPVSFTAKYLLERAIEGNVDDYWYGIEQNFFQGLISKVNDDKLKDLPGEPKRKLAHFPPKDYAYDIIIGNDSIWLRYFNDFVNNNDNGFNPNEILLENGKTLAQEFKVEVDKKFQQDPNVIQFQNNLIKNLLLGEDIKAQKELNEFTKKLAGEKKKARRLNSKKLDKSRVIKIDDNAPTSEEIRQAEILDKALNIARDPNAPTKKIRVFDFDDTLARTKSNVLYTMPDGTKGKLTAEEFAKKGDKMLAEGAVWDFSEFNKVMKGKKGPLFEVAKKIQDTRGTKDVFVLTARAKEAAPAIKEFLDSVGLEIPLENITGLGDSSPLAKSGWIVDKAADGYNDFYFADDHLGNVDAVKRVLDVIDVKSKVQQAKVKFKKNVDKMMNNIIFEKTGIEQYKEFSEVGAQARGRKKRSFALIPSSAQDFGGLLYKLLGKGKAGDTQWQWMQENLIKPYGRAMNDLSVAQNQLMADFRELKNSLQGIPKNLKKKAFDGFTNEDVVRVVAWDRQGVKVDGLSKRDLDKMKKYVESKADLNIFVDELITITKGDGYHYPGASWLAGTITTDFIEGLRKTTRPKLLQQWQENVDLAFNESNMNKLEAAFGSKYREALENALERMKTGRNRRQGMGRLEQRFLDYLNNSVGAVMFLNARSAVLQTISAVNFVNWTDNNPIKAGAAFANQPQYWKDFIELMNSDFLVDRRNGLKINVSESEIAEAAKTTGNSVKGVISYLLNKGFVFTQIADSFAIASGGATFYRNRIKTYMKEGMSEAEAKEKAFLEFRDLAEESQQSSRADKISQQQASTLGRIVLAFANTPSQYARIMDKAGRDLINGRGDWKSNISKIMYYGFVQNLLFTTLQQAIFAVAGEEDEEEIEDKTINAANSMLDNILRGLGVQGTIISASKNVIVDLIKRSEKDPYFNPDADPFPGPKYEESVFKLIEVSPPLAIKLKKWRSGWLDYQFNRWRPEASDWFNINNPNYRAASKIIASVTNVPLDRLFQKIENIQGAMDETNEPWQRVAMFLGWPKWQLETSAAKEERKAKEKEQKKAIKAIDKPSIYTKEEQVNILKQYKLTDEEIKELKNEDLRVEKIKELRDSTKVIHTPKASHLKPVVKDTLKPVTPKTDSTKVTFITTKPATNKSERKKITIENRTARQARLYKLSKANQIDTLRSLGVTPEVIKTLKYEEDRVRKIEELYDKD